MSARSIRAARFGRHCLVRSGVAISEVQIAQTVREIARSVYVMQIRFNFD